MSESADKGHHSDSTLRPGRPFPLKVIFWVFALWTLLGWLRVVQVLGEARLILDLLGPGLFGYLLLVGLVWGLLGLSVLWGLVRRASWAPLVIRVAAVVYPAIYWIERTLLWRDPFAQRNWPFMLLLTLIWFGLVAWGLRAAHRKTFFADQNQQG